MKQRKSIQEQLHCFFIYLRLSLGWARGKVYLMLDHYLTTLKFRASAEDPAMFQPFCWEPMQKTRETAIQKTSA